MPTVTLAELLVRVYDQLEQNDQLYTFAQLTAAINESYRIVNAFCGINQSLVSVPGFSVANQLLYTVPSPILFPLSAYFEGRLLRKSSLGSLARNNRGWATNSTHKSGPVRSWAPIGITQFVIHPYDSLGGRDIAVQGVIEPTPLVILTDILQVEDEYLDMIISLTAHRAQLKEGGRVFANSSQTMLNEFYRGLKDRIIFRDFKAPTYKVLTSPSQ